MDSINKKDLDREINKYTKYFTDIEKELKSDNPDLKKINELAKDGKNLKKLKDKIKLNPAVREANKHDRTCVVCAKKFKSTFKTTSFHDAYCRKRAEYENKDDKWPYYYEQFKKFYEVYGVIPQFSWGHRQRVRKNIPEDKKELLLKICDNFFVQKLADNEGKFPQKDTDFDLNDMYVGKFD